MSRGNVGTPFNARPLFSLCRFFALSFCAIGIHRRPDWNFLPFAKKRDRERRGWYGRKNRFHYERYQNFSLVKTNFRFVQSRYPSLLASGCAIPSIRWHSVYRNSVDRVKRRCGDLTLVNLPRTRDQPRARSILRRGPVLPAEWADFGRSAS